MSKWAQVGDFCPNPTCADYGKAQTSQQKNLIRSGRTKGGQQRYQCRTGQQTFTETKGTLFYGRHTPASELIKVLAQLAEGNRISSVTRTPGHKEDTILAWLKQAAAQVNTIEAILMAD